VAKRPRHSTVNGSRFKIDASPSHNPRPLEQGNHLLRTLHFAIDVELPDKLFDDLSLPVVTVEVKPDEGYVVEPSVVQVELEHDPTAVEADAAA